jgi:hypothetical protein
MKKFKKLLSQPLSLAAFVKWNNDISKKRKDTAVKSKINIKSVEKINN